MAVMNPLGVAFKEWAVICQALAEGRQALILRKGGIVEPDGGFRVEHDRFWLYPTFVHQMEEGVIEAYRPLLTLVRASAPEAGTVRLQHLAEVVEVCRLTTLEQAHALTGLHGWSEAVVTARFHYRTPGLYALIVRIRQAGSAVEITETDEYRGCKSWVQLGEALPVGQTQAVMSEEALAGVREEVRRRIGAPQGSEDSTLG